MVIVETCGKTDVGRKRSNNEDALFYDDKLRLYVVADGMGGHQAGEEASRLVVETIPDYIKKFYSTRSNDSNVQPADATLTQEANVLISSIKEANRVVFESSLEKQAHRGMGSTVSLVFLTPQDTLIAANVGDSPIFLVRNGSIDLLSVPHTVNEEYKALLDDTSNPIGNAYKHMLTRAMGIEREVNPDICEIQSLDGDTLVICSDGLSNKVDSSEIHNIVIKHGAEEACRSLIDLANNRGGEDNITVIIIKIKQVRKKGNIVSRFLKRLFGGG